MNRRVRGLLKFLKYFSVVIGLWWVIEAGIDWWCARPKFDTVYIPKSDFRSATFGLERAFSEAETRTAKFEFKDLKEPYFISNYHWLKDGEKTVLVYRSFSEGSIFTRDDERFTQLTVALPKIEEKTIQLDGKQIRALYTTGASAWPYSQCGAVIENGTIKVSRILNGRITARIDFEAKCKNQVRKREKPVSFHEDIDFSELSFENAKPWHGKKGDNIYQETYRR